VIKDFAKEFPLEHFEIPKQDTKLVKWTMTYNSIHDLNHWFIVDFEGMEPMGVMIDG